MFAIVAVPFDAFQALPRPEHRWLLTCFSRYVDRAGAAFPSLRQLARDARMSLASVCQRMTELEQLAVFQRQRRPSGRYCYVLAEAYRPRWPGRSGDLLNQDAANSESASASCPTIASSGKRAAVVAAIAILAAALGPEADRAGVLRAIIIDDLAAINDGLSGRH